MPKLSELKNKARRLIEKTEKLFQKSHGSTIGCLGFFPASIPYTILHDMQIIKAITDYLDGFDDCYGSDGVDQTKLKRDIDLMRFLQGKKIHALLSWSEFLEFKTSILIGCYLLKYEQYRQSAPTIYHKQLLHWLESDLEINASEQWTVEKIHVHLDALSQFCSFVYEQKDNNRDYSKLNHLLGDSIQADIHSAMHPMKTAHPVLLDAVYWGMDVIGITMNNV